MRILPQYTLDYSGTPTKRPLAPTYKIHPWTELVPDRPWHHVRYHSSHQIETPDGPTCQTLHLLMWENEEAIDFEYSLPHEGRDGVVDYLRYCSVSLETAPFGSLPQNEDDPFEVMTMKTKVRRRAPPSSITRRDFVTKRPLRFRPPVLDDYGETVIFLPIFHRLGFVEVEVRPLRAETHRKRWASTRATREQRAAD